MKLFLICYCLKKLLIIEIPQERLWNKPAAQQDWRWTNSGCSTPEENQGASGMKLRDWEILIKSRSLKILINYLPL